MDSKIKEEILELVENGYIYRRSPKRVGGKVYIYLVPPEGGKAKSYSIEIESEEDFVYLKRDLPWRMRSISGKSYYTGSKRRRKEEEAIEDASHKTYQRAVGELIARDLEYIAKRDLFISTIMDKIGFRGFMILVSKMHLSPGEWKKLRNDPDKLADRILEFLVTVIEHHEDPERLERVEKENEQLKQENNKLKAQLKEKDAFIEEYRMQLSEMSTMLTSLQYKRFVEWNNMRYTYGWSTLTPEQAQQAYFVPIPYNRDDEMFEHMLETAATIKMIDIVSGNNSGVPSSAFLKFATKATSLLGTLQRNIASNSKDIASLEKSVMDLQTQQLKHLVSGLDNTPKQIIEVKVPSQSQDTMTTGQKIEYLESLGYQVTPPPSEDRVREIVREVMRENKETRCIIDAETAKIIMDGILILVDKFMAYYLYRGGLITKQEFVKWAHLENIMVPTLPS